MFKAFSKLKQKDKPYDELRRELSRWYLGEIGQQLLALAKPKLEQQLSNLFGYHLIQVGSLEQAELHKGSRVNCRTVLDSGIDQILHDAHAISCEVDQLSIATDSVDVVILPHTLEIHPNAHQIVRELDRTLMPEGRVLIMGFNPYSLWGFTMWLRKVIGRLPWHGRFLSPRRVKDWFTLLGYEIEHCEFYFYRPAVPSSRLMKRLQFLERWGGRYWPILGGGYILVAKKRVTTLNPIRPGWRVANRIRAVGAAQSSIHREVIREED